MNPPQIELSPAHLDALQRQRRVVINFDVLLIDPAACESVDAIVKDRNYYPKRRGDRDE